MIMLNPASENTSFVCVRYFVSVKGVYAMSNMSRLSFFQVTFEVISWVEMGFIISLMDYKSFCNYQKSHILCGTPHCKLACLSVKWIKVILHWTADFCVTVREVTDHTPSNCSCPHIIFHDGGFRQELPLIMNL